MLMNSLKGRLPTELLEFIKVDVKEFMTSFFPGVKYDMETLRFEAITSEPCEHFLLVPLRQRNASELTGSSVKAWGIEVKKKIPKL